MDMKGKSRPSVSAASTSDGGPVRRLAGRVKRILRIGARAKEGVGQPGAAGEGSTEAYLPRARHAQERARASASARRRCDGAARRYRRRSDHVSLGELLNVFRNAAHSRVPVYGETLDEPRGMVHIRDFLDYLGAKAQESGERQGKGGEPLADLGGVDLATPLEALGILRPVLYVPASMRAVALLRRMQATRTHMALVIDEYGGTDGLVSIEDLIEIVVGEIEDEHDDEEGALVSRLDDRTLVASARAELAEVSAMLGIDLSRGHAAEDVDTIGGLIVTLAGRVPLRGELIAGPGGIEFEVMEADPRRLKRVRIHLHSSERRSRRQKDQPLEATQTPSTTGVGAPPSEPSRPDRGAGAASEPNRR